MDKITLIRSIADCRDEHDATICLTGYSRDQSKLVGGRPSLGAVVSKVAGPTDPAVPPFVGLCPKTIHAPWGQPGRPRLPRPGPRPVHPQRFPSWRA